MQRRTPVVLVVCLAAVCSVVILSLAAPATAAVQQNETTNGSIETPDTPEEYLTTFREMEGSPAFGNYSEFELVRSQAVQDVQVGEFTDEKAERMEQVYLLLVTFETAYERGENDSHAEALAKANRVREITNRLQDVEGGEPYALSAEIALDRFYEQTGQEMLGTAEEATSTPERIRLLNQSSTAYDRAGAAQRFAEIEQRLSRVEQDFKNDRQQMEEHDDQMASFVDSCNGCDSVVGVVTTQHVGVFSMYPRALSAQAAGDESITIAQEHGLDERQATLESRRTQVQSYSRNLALVAGSLVLLFSVVVGITAAIITWRLMLWRRDLVAAERGDVVLMGEMLDA